MNTVSNTLQWGTAVMNLHDGNVDEALRHVFPEINWDFSEPEPSPVTQIVCILELYSKLTVH